MASRLHTEDSTEYRRIPRQSQSSLKRCWEDPQLFYETDIAKTRPEPPPTEAQIFGTNIERYLFGGGCDPNVVIIPESALNNGARRNRKGEKNWDDFQAANSGKRLLKQSEYDDEIGAFRDIKANIDSCPKAATLIYGGEKKKVILWSHLGLELKSELDILHSHVIVDLKAVARSHISAEGFSKHCITYGWHIQAGAYQKAVEQHTGAILPFVFIAIQNEPSYSVELYTLSEKFMAHGRERFDEMIDYFKLCQESGDWHSSTWDRIIEVDPPAWYEKQMEAWVT